MNTKIALYKHEKQLCTEVELTKRLHRNWAIIMRVAIRMNTKLSTTLAISLFSWSS